MNSIGETARIDKFRHKIALIIPTRNRPRILARLLDSIKTQTVHPDQVVIVDGSDQPIEAEIKPYINPSVTYKRVFPPGLTRQRNQGRDALREEITLVGYLDDDIVLEKDATEAMLSFWETASEDIAGASFNITNSYPAKVNSKGKTPFLYSFFGLNDSAKGRILKSGAATGLSPLSENIYTQWLCGGATIWKRSIFRDFSYDEWFKGYAYFEDVDFSYSVSRKHKLAVVSTARVLHLPPPLKPQRVSSYIKAHAVQQYYFVRKHHELSMPRFYWSITGSIVLNTLVGIRRLRAESFSSVGGYLSGLYEIIFSKIKQSEESFRE